MLTIVSIELRDTEHDVHAPRVVFTNTYDTAVLPVSYQIVSEARCNGVPPDFVNHSIPF
jgi:hypothetical protein